MRTPIGRYGGMFASLTAVDLGVTALKGLLDRTGIAPDAVRRRDSRPLLSEQRGARDRSRGRAGRRPAGDRSRYAGRPALRLGSAGGHPGLHAGQHRQRRPRRGGRRGKHEQRRLLLDGHALGRSEIRRQGARRAGARPNHRGRAALPGARRHAGDRREPAPPVRHLAAASRTSWRSHRISGRSPRRRTASSPRRSSRSPCARARARRSSTPTSIPAPTPRWSRWPS